MEIAEQAYFRSELERRQTRLLEVLGAASHDNAISSLLAQVDAALARLDGGTFGLCKTCHEPVERERLVADPLVEFCLDDLKPEERRALESDLALAASIQSALLPAKNFAPQGWRVAYHFAPVSLVGGDYCDLFEARNSLVFLLGDVSGKGIAASMLMSHLHATFRSLADSELGLDRMVAAANRIFAASTMAGHFATLVIGRASPDGAVEFVSAGHLPFLLLHGNETRLQDSTGVPLGMFSQAQFTVHHLDVAPGDALFLYTDGVTEARNANGEEYGIGRVKTLCGSGNVSSPDDLIRHCLADLQVFAPGAKATDDLTLLAIQRPV
ncbi:MAG TPA: SpoIIE family protein phosphatase [Candidatus Saccharimonadales bacterium]|nr:SpoIIE family protein phosphatase [Candidatus Saccharimonadales bacterium]